MDDRDLKVLSVSTSDSDGGAAKAAHRIHEGVGAFGVQSKMFVKEKHLEDCSVFSLSDFKPHSTVIRLSEWISNKIKNKFQHIRWGHYPNRDSGFMSDLRATHLYGALRKMEYDVLHLHWFNLRFLPLASLKKVHKPIIWTLHDSWAFCGICHVPGACHRYEIGCGQCPMLHSKGNRDLSYRVNHIKLRIYKHLDLHVICPSRWLADCARKSLVFQNADIRVIPNCLDTDFFSPATDDKDYEAFGLDRNTRYIVYGAMGAFTDKNKGFEKLNAALTLIPVISNCQNLELVIFGEEMAKDVECPFPVHCLGKISDQSRLVALYRLAAVVVVPSLSEVFCQVAAEAMSCGTPVAAFGCTGLVDVIDHKLTGYLARPYDVEDLAYGILWCLENNDSMHLSANARKKVLEHFSQGVVCAQYSSLYKEVA